MAAVPSHDQVMREVFKLSSDEKLPLLDIVDEPDPHRRLSLVVPLSSFEATWVQYEETPTFFNTARTKFVVRPPFDARRPPRFTLYSPHEETIVDRELLLSVVDENEPFESDATSTWLVYSLHNAQTPVTKGVMIRQGESTIVLYDADRGTEESITWPNKNIRLVRDAPPRFGTNGEKVLFGQCASGLPSPIGLRYGIAECVSARLSYMFELQRVDVDDVPAYSCTAQRQYTVTNASDVNFSRVGHLVIASETFATSVDGFPTRSFVAEVQQEPTPIIKPLFSLRETMMNIPARSTHILTEVAATIDQCFVVATIEVVPTVVGQHAVLSFDAWLPTEALNRFAVQPAPAQLHVDNGVPFYDTLTGVLYWQRDEESARAPWTRIPLSTTTTRIGIQCVNKQTMNGSYQVALTGTNFFIKPMLLAFALHPGRLDSCSNIEAIEGAHRVESLPWMNSTRGVTYAAFVLNDRKEPISFRGVVFTAK